MACVTVTNVSVLDNPARFENPFQVRARPNCLAREIPLLTRWSDVAPTQFEVSFECIAPIPDDIEWKLT